MTIAVTGATGHLGRLVVEDLVASQDPASVVAVVRDPAKAADLEATGAQVRVASYDEPAALKDAFAGVDTLLLVSGNELGKRVAQHSNAIDAAVSAGVKRVVYTSAPHASTTSLILAPEHKATEEYLAAAGIPFTVLRNGWYSENYEQALQTAKVTGTVVAAVGAGKVASATRADLAAAAAVVLTSEGHEGKIYELTGDYAWDFDELAATIGEVLGREVVYQPVSQEALADILTTHAGLDAGTARFVASLDGDIEKGLVAEVSSDLTTLLGRPTTPLADSLRAAL